MFTFKFPDIGEGIHEGTILKWHVKVGDKVAEGDLLVVVETDKVNAELTSPEAGTIKELGPKEGEIIHVGDTVALIDNGSGGNEEPQKIESVKETKEEKPKENGAGVVGEIMVSDEIIGSYQTEAKKTTSRVLASPVARKIASDMNVDLST
ncbi:MAG: 2-oxo acid dehydrogenase subunit E2, partial [Acholeplasmataceae bacterium]|nr:2-oxo acid dehydrogenase subunit E2 [Acholeplasmataceae bacterium]